jgi:hypothetical protein
VVDYARFNEWFASSVAISPAWKGFSRRTVYSRVARAGVPVKNMSAGQDKRAESVFTVLGLELELQSDSE